VFEAPGFCPTDGNPLAATTPAAAASTIISAKIEAERQKTEVERRRTFPMAPPPQTEEVTSARVRPQPDLPTALPQEIRAVSASESPSKVLELYQQTRQNEYDKLIGQTLDGRYYVERKIGEGGMGVVFAARHAVIERALAIKVLKREVMRDTATIKRFIQ
jgi:serine/threonine-protein kinase